MSSGLGYGRIRLIEKIVNLHWEIKDPRLRQYTYNELLFILQELLEEEGRPYQEGNFSAIRGHAVFRKFTEYLLYRNLANYDSMILLTSEKGCITGDALLEMPRNLKKYPKGIPLKELEGKGQITVYCVNIKTGKLAKKISDGVEFVKFDNIYKIKLKDGRELKGTSDHPILMSNKKYKQLIDIIPGDFIFQTSMKSGEVENVEYLGKQKVYDVVNVKDNHNFIVNGFVVSNTGKSSAAMMLARYWCSLIGIRFNPSRHIAYNNADVMNKIHSLNKFEPIIADESIRFACVAGETLIKTPSGNIPIKELEGKKYFPVYSFNEETKKEEIQIAEKCVQTKVDWVYELETECGEKIQCTKEHKFLTPDGWFMLSEFCDFHQLITIKGILNIKSIKKIKKVPVYDIINVQNNNNYIANNFIEHNSSEDWNKKENKELKKKLGQVRTKHLLYILCFPLKLYKLEKTYLESYVNYWIDLFGRGVGACYVKDRNPVLDTWRTKDFRNVGSYTEFTSLNQVRDKLKKHPNFWQIVRFPKPPKWLYTKYLKVREMNVYDDENVLANVSKEDIQRALLILALRDIMKNDINLTMNRIILHINNEFDIKLTKAQIQDIINDSKQLVTKVRETAQY